MNLMIYWRIRMHEGKYRIGDMVKFNKPGIDESFAYDKIKSIEILITECSRSIAYGMELYNEKTIPEDEILEGPDHTPKRRRRQKAECE